MSQVVSIEVLRNWDQLPGESEALLDKLDLTFNLALEGSRRHRGGSLDGELGRRVHLPSGRGLELRTGRRSRASVGRECLEAQSGR